MKCIKCGNELGENDIFCPICGTSVRKTNEEKNNQNIYNGQANYGGQSNEKIKNNNTVKMCVIVVVIVIVLACALIMGRDKMNANGGEISNRDTLDDYSTSTSGKGKVTSTSSVSATKANSYKINFNGFKFYIPDNLIYDVNYADKQINIGDSESTWVAQLMIVKGPYQQLKKNKNSLTKYFTEKVPGGTISDIKVETIGGVEYVLLEVSLAGENAIIGYAELNSMYSLGFSIVNENNDFDKENIKNISTIVSNAEYTGDSQYVKSDENIKMTDISTVFEALEDTNNDEE